MICFEHGKLDQLAADLEGEIDGLTRRDLAIEFAGEPGVFGAERHQLDRTGGRVGLGLLRGARRGEQRQHHERGEEAGQNGSPFGSPSALM